MRSPVAKEGFPFIFVFAILTFFTILVKFSALAWILFFVTLFVVYFFRDPERLLPYDLDEKFIVSPADGKIIKVCQVEESPLGCPAYQIDIFMTMFSVHINRMPFGGQIFRKTYIHGKFFPAFREKASFLNEQLSLAVNTIGGRIIMVQIAGLVARRIVCWAQEGKAFAKGERFGLIKFGSRFVLYLPLNNTTVVTNVGDRVIGGKSVIGSFITIKS